MVPGLYALPAMSAVAQREDKSANSAIVSFRGQPLTDTPTKSVNSTFPSNSRLPVRKNKLLPLLAASNSSKYRIDNAKSSRKDGENEDDMLTRENTKANTGYKTIKLQTVRVQMTTPKPPSPSSHFRRDALVGPKKHFTAAKNIVSPERKSNREDECPSPLMSRQRRVKFIKQTAENSGMKEEVREIPYYDTTIPLTSCLKKEPSVTILRNRNSEDEDLIVVKKLVYPPTPIKSRKKR